MIVGLVSVRTCVSLITDTSFSQLKTQLLSSWTALFQARSLKGIQTENLQSKFNFLTSKNPV